MVYTVDFFTPIVDDPEIFGMIAAANSLSDIYAMGAEPIAALNIACLPTKKQGMLDLFNRIVAGGVSKLDEAGCTLIGGHTLEDDDLKFGYTIIGRVHPDRLVTNADAKPGDLLILSKKLGTGALGSALKSGKLSSKDQTEFIDSMLQLNKAACQVMQGFKVKAATDVTGYGLAGHAFEMARASDVKIILYPMQIPYFKAAFDLLSQGKFITRSTRQTAQYLKDFIDDASNIKQPYQSLLFDPQTSGGLLICIQEKSAKSFIQALYDNRVRAATIVGRVIERKKSEKFIGFE